MAQLVARLVRNEKVGGSNPPSSTIRVGLIARPFVYLLFFWVQKIPVTSEAAGIPVFKNFVEALRSGSGTRACPQTSFLASPASNPTSG